MRLYYLETILPIVRKINFAIQDTLDLTLQKMLQIFLHFNQNYETQQLIILLL